MINAWPDYYKEFKCSSSRCKHNCCIGWEIDIDEQTLSKYSLLDGKLASKLKDCIDKNSGDAHFILDDDDRCPFLCEDGLCELIKEAGDDLLCDICNEHPRYHNYYSDRVESGIGLCCEEAARIIVCHSGKISLVDNGASESCNGIERLFFERRQNIFDIIQDANSSIDEKLHILERNSSFKYPSLSMQELLSKFGAEKVFSIKESSSNLQKTDTKEPPIEEQVRTNKLLEFMLRKGYINEEYADYINFFKGNSISVADMNFIFSVKTQNPKEFTYSLSPSKLPQIIAKLQPHEFAERAILNFNLLEHMLACHDYDDKLEIFIRQLSNEANDSWSFINEFIDKTDQHKRFIKMLVEAWPQMWDEIHFNTVLTYERQVHYLSILCIYLSNEELSSLNVNGSLTRFFVENEDILQRLSSITVEKLKDIITTLKINFRKLAIAGVSSSLLDFVFDSCYYELNSDMIRSIVEYKNAALCNGLNFKNYTVITQLGYEPLLEYVHKNFGIYIDTIVMRKENTKETVRSVLTMLDRSVDDLERCNRIITHIVFSLDSLTEVCNEYINDNGTGVQNVWDMLLGSDKLNASWCAIYDYWKTFGLSDELGNYIARHADILANKDASCLDDEFKESVILSDLDIKAFKKILSQIRMDAFTIGLDEISNEKLDIMVQNRSFNFTVADYEEMEQYAPELCVQFILLNQQEFEKVFAQITLNAKVFESLVVSEKFSNHAKERILDHDGVGLMTEKVANYLCSSNLCINRNVFTAAWECLGDVSLQKELLFKHLNVLELKDFERYLMDLESPYKELKRSAYRHDVIIPDNQENRNLVNRLQIVQFLTSVAYEKQIRNNPEREIPVIRCRVKAKSTPSALTNNK